MLLFYDIFVLGIIFITLVICLILIIKGKQQKRSKFFLATILFIISWYAMIYLLINTGMILQCTFLFGWGMPVYYLIPPFCYWYVLSIFKPEWKWKKSDLIHLLPALIGLIDTVPIIFSPEKQTIIETIVKDFGHFHLYNTTWLIPHKVHFIARPVQGLGYMTAIWLLLLPSVISNKDAFRRNQSRNNHWLLIFTILMTTIYLALATFTFIGMTTTYEGKQVFDTIKIPLIWLAISFFALGMYLFLNPSILYGMEEQKIPDKKVLPDKKTEALTTQQMNQYAGLLERYIQQESPYRRQGISINDFATETGIPARTLSYVLNQYYKMRFTDFVNKYRISYVIARLNEGYWKHVTLEGLALEAGFSSRSTFFSAFKKITDQSPSQYIDDLKQSDLTH